MNPPNTIASDTLVEAIVRGIAKAKGIEICADASYWHSKFGPLAQAALTAITDAGMAIVPVEPTVAMKEAGATAWRDALEDDWRSDAADIYRAMINAAQAIEARSGETEGLDPQGESAALQGAPDHIMPPIRDSGPLESEEGE